MDVPRGYDPTLILVLNLAGTFVFGLSGGLAAVRARLDLFGVAGATKALDFGVGPVPAVLLGAITGIGGGMLRDILLREVPTVLRHELYAVPALLGAAVLVIAQESGSDNPLFPALGAAVCFAVRLAGLKYRVNVPIAPSERRGE